MKNIHFFNKMLDEIVASGRKLPGVSNKQLIEMSNNRLYREIDESVCQGCGSVLRQTSENMGDDNYPYYEFTVYCPNGCIQDEEVYVL